MGRSIMESVATAASLLWGRERLIIREANAVIEGGDLWLHSTETEHRLWIYPKIERTLIPSISHAVAEDDGQFTRLTITQPAKEIALAVEMISPTKAAIKIPSSALAGLCT